MVTSSSSAYENEAAEPDVQLIEQGEVEEQEEEYNRIITI